MHWPSWCSALCWSQSTFKSGDPAGSYLGFTRSTDVAPSKTGATELCNHLRWCRNVIILDDCPNCSTGAHPLRRHQTLVTHVLHALCVHASQPRAAHRLQHACDCRDCGESASTWAAPTFWGFLPSWKSLNVLCCTAKAIWAICPQMGKAPASSCSPARADVAVLSKGESCQSQVDCSVSCPHPHRRGYPGFCILWHILNSTLCYPE